MLIFSVQVFSKHIIYQSEVLIGEKKVIIDESKEQDASSRAAAREIQKNKIREMLSIAGTKGFSYKNQSGRNFTNGKLIFQFSATDDLSGKERIEYSLDNAAYKPYVNPIILDKSGLHTLKYRSIDNVGNKEAATVLEYYVDVTNPEMFTSISGTRYQKGNILYFASDVKITADASDSESGVKGIYADVNGKGHLPFAESELDFTQAGDYIVSLITLDNVLNKSAEKTYWFKVDTDAPEADIKIAPMVKTEDIPLCSSKSRITLTADDKSSGVKIIQFRMKGEEKWSDYLEPVAVPYGTELLQVEYKAIDNVLNESKIKEFTCKIDKKAPKTNNEIRQ